MPEHTSPVSGTFCWVELQTTDLAASKAFYASLFGWTITDLPGQAPYAVASVDSSMTAGLKDLPAEARAMGAQPQWLSYIAVDDVRASADKATALGATLLLPPATMGPGTFSVLRDPTGAAFALWNSTESVGTRLYGELGACGWNELATTDIEAARAFYSSLFGWTTESVPMPNMEYALLKHSGQDVGGMMAMPEEAEGTPSYWGVYFVVADADAAFGKALAMGAHVIMPLVDVPTVGRFGFLVDPQGAMFAVIRFEARAA